jgi:hypothetical protein
MPRGVDQINEVFKVLPRCIVNDRRGIGVEWRERSDEKACRDAIACYPQRYPMDFCS